MDKIFGKMLARRVQEMNKKYGTDWVLTFDDDSCCGPSYETVAIRHMDGRTILFLNQYTDTLIIAEKFLDGYEYANTGRI